MEFIEPTLSGIVIPTGNTTVDLAFTGGGGDVPPFSVTEGSRVRG